MMQERARKKISTQEAIAQGERALMLAAGEGMTKEEVLQLRRLLRENGVPEDTLLALFPEIAHIQD